MTCYRSWKEGKIKRKKEKKFPGQKKTLEPISRKRKSSKKITKKSVR